MPRLLKLRVAVYGVIFDELVTSPNDGIKLSKLLEGYRGYNACLGAIG